MVMQAVEPSKRIEGDHGSGLPMAVVVLGMDALSTGGTPSQAGEVSLGA
jgi:hypothetical protein